MLFDYDDGDIESIKIYAKKLVGRTFRDIKEEFDKSPIKRYHNLKNPIDFSIEEDEIEYASNSKAKGELGNFLEKYYFGYKPNSNQDADFPKVGVELKQTCIDKTKKDTYRAGERLSITNISYKEPVIEDFYKSHVWKKIQHILLVHYIRDKSMERLDYKIQYVNYFSPPEEDIEIIIDDYNKINQKIKEGRAHEISEGDTMYLGACTKGSTAASSLQPQYYGEHILAKKRNFCFKQSYMNYILHNYIEKDNVPFEPIVKENIKESFQDYVISLINKHKGKTDKELCELFDRPYNNNKAQWNDLTFRMLGIKSNRAAEFEKANIVMKTIRIEENGKNRESISLPPFKFMDLVNEEWEDSTVFDYFDTTQFLFVVFRRIGEKYVLKGAQLWHMPHKDLNEIVCKEWNMYKKIIKGGIELIKEEKENGEVEIRNNLPGMKDTEIIHIRPHAQKAAYKLKDGFVKGNILKDADELPNGEWMTKQSFWLNREYVLKQLIVN